MPYIQKRRWRPFVYQDVTYGFAHLDEHMIVVTDSDKAERKIVVTCSDHCFTKKPEEGDDPALLYPTSSRNPGYFCTERYRHSLGLRSHIIQATTRKVWCLDDDGFAIVPIIDHRGAKTLYGIIFSLVRVTGLPIDLHMRVKSAYPCDKKDITTYGQIRFAHLVALRLQGTNPNRDFGRHRRRPRLF